VPSLHARRASGFSFIELMVAVAIIAILAAIVAPRVIGRLDDAAQTKARADIRAISTALSMYRLDNFAYPSTEQGLQALVARPGGEPPAPNWRAGGYLQGGLPKDPWGRDYLYLAPGRNGDFDVYTLGADGRPGGEGSNADIGNWMP
jgi:general secretion pathway protein G